MLLLLLVAALAAAPPTTAAHAAAAGRTLPVVFLHGMGDSCCSAWSLGSLAEDTSKALGVPVVSIDTGGGRGVAADVASGFFGRADALVARACADLEADTRLADGFNAVGFSQGGLFLRAVAQRCPHLPLRTLITLGAPHYGVAAPPACPWNASLGKTLQQPQQEPSPPALARLCSIVEAALNAAAFAPPIQAAIIQAQYYRPPDRLADYLVGSLFLADINNERPLKNDTYASSLARLHRFIAFRFDRDITVVPRDSAWFAGVDADGRLVGMREAELFQRDWIGLRALDDRGALTLATAPGAHMQISRKWFQESVVDAYLRGADDEEGRVETS